jgi:hypothetical protein
MACSDRGGEGQATAASTNQNEGRKDEGVEEQSRKECYRARRNVAAWYIPLQLLAEAVC